MEGYSVSVVESSRELSAKERIKIKDTTDALKLDEATHNGAIVITPDMFAVLLIHNEKSSDKEYNNYVIVDKDGTKYVTGSASFWSSFKGIYDEMSGESEEYSIKVYRSPSKNYTGKEFITCSIQ